MGHFPFALRGWVYCRKIFKHTVLMLADSIAVFWVCCAVHILNMSFYSGGGGKIRAQWSLQG